jgi:hypothetical protein
VLLVGGVVGSPMFKGEEEAPGYEINPHFGFRKYFEIRYEPISEPYVGYQPVDNIQQNYHQQVSSICVLALSLTTINLISFGGSSGHARGVLLIPSSMVVVAAADPASLSLRYLFTLTYLLVLLF